ncbi:MAG: hypothetical protein ACTSYE_11190 [Alphaproteobacteria bacterium]
MTDLHALLKKSIIDKGISDPQDRYDIYAEARKAVIRRLTDRDPPLQAHAIGDRVAAFDTAVVDIEDELREHFLQRAGLPAPDPDYRADATANTLAAPRPMRTRYHDDPEPEPHADDMATNGADLDDEPLAQGGDERTVYDDDTDGRVGEAGGTYEDAAYDGDTYDGDDHGGEGYDAPLGYDPQGTDEPRDPEEGEEAYRTPLPDDRWSQPRSDGETGVGPREAQIVPQPRRRRFDERTKVNLLVGAITALIVALGTFGAVYMLSEPSEEDGVTVAIDDRRQVSDSATALRIASEDLSVRQTFVLFEGFDPTVFESSSTNPVRFDSDGNGSFARVASSADAAGARLRVGPGLATQLAGQQIRVRVIARASRERGALAMRFAYQSGIAISHWQTANLEPDYTEVGILWRVPEQRTSTAGDYLIIEPGIPGDGSGADIRAVEVDVLLP